MSESIDSIRLKIAQLTEQIAHVASSGSRGGDFKSWSMNLAEDLCKKYHMPKESLQDRLEEAMAPLNLSDEKLNELRELILNRCALSLKVAELKGKEATNLPKDRGAIAEFVKRREIEEWLLSKVFQNIDFGTMERKRAVLKLLELIFGISRELQVSYLSGMKYP